MSTIFEVAMEKERQMAELYTKLAEKCKNTHLHNVLTMLAQQESKHYSNLEQIAEQHQEEDHSDIITDVREIFLKIKEKRHWIDINTSQIELYREVRDFEKENEDFYRRKAKEMTDPKLQKLLNTFADEEHKHFLLMSEVVDFVERPEKWVEDAEFNHIEEY